MVDYHDPNLKPLFKALVFAIKADCKVMCLTSRIGHEHALREVKRNHYKQIHKLPPIPELGNSPRSNPPLLHIMSPDKQSRNPSNGNSSNNRNKGFSDSGDISINDRLLLFLR